MRLNAYLARTGVASRRGADELIKAGRVRVNGEPGQLNTFVETGDRVELDGEPVTPQGLAYVLLHKPAGVVTTARDPHGRPTVVGLVLHEGRKHQVKRMCAAVGHPVTRLHRSRYAGLTLEGLEPGAWRELEPSEADQLRTRPLRAPRTGRSGPGKQTSTP